jgi:hypothetical protein
MQKAHRKYEETLKYQEKQHETEYEKCLKKIDEYSKDGSTKAIVIFYSKMDDLNIQKLKNDGYTVKLRSNSMTYLYTITWDFEEKHTQSSKFYFKKMFLK